MKRIGNLYERICSFENLWAAACRARRGKRFRADVAAFHYHQERHLLELRDELRARTYVPGPYRSFTILDPKRRLISAAPYRDRVVHHALCQVIEPVFECGFIDASYANRLGKGTHRAIDRCTQFARRYAYALKCDIEKYFPSIDHAILMERLERKIKCAGTLWLIRKILENSNPQEEAIRYFPGDNLFTPWERRHGIPIGNLTSQFFGNVCLDGLDHFVKETLREPAYLRFADDFLVFSNDRERLAALPGQLQEYLDRFRLNLHPRKCQVVPTRCGVPFLGWLIFADHRRVRRATGVRFERRLRELQSEYAEGRIGFEDVRASVMSWIGHLRHGDTWGLRRRLLAGAAFPARPRPPAARSGSGIGITDR